MAPVEIPGFYFDTAKNKYFKIETTSNSSSSSISKYNSENIKRQKAGKQHDRLKRKIKSSSNNNKNLPSLNDLIGFKSKVLRRHIYESRDLISTYKFKSFNFCKSFKFSELIDEPVEKILDFDNKLYLSSTRKLYSIDAFNSNDKLLVNDNSRNSNDLFYSLDLKLLYQDYNLSHFSKIRNIHFLENSKLFIRTIFGDNKDRSQVQILKLDQENNLMHENTNFYSKITQEFFNNSYLNSDNNCLLICSNKNLINYDILKSKSINQMKSKEIISVERIRENSCYLTGLRNGDLNLIDDRLKNRINLANSNNKCNEKKKSIINIKNLNNNKVLISTIGGNTDNESNLKIFDIRTKFDLNLIEFHSSKFTENCFNEKISLLNNNNFIIKFNKDIEIFNIDNKLPINKINFKNNINDFYYSTFNEEIYPIDDKYLHIVK